MFFPIPLIKSLLYSVIFEHIFRTFVPYYNAIIVPEQMFVNRISYRLANICLLFCILYDMIKYNKVLYLGGLSMEYGKISKKQKEILEYIKSEIINRGFPPAVREICEAVHLKSTSSVHAHLETLEKNGYIKRDPTKPRAIEIVDDNFNLVRRETVSVPVVGRVAAGEPILAIQNVESYFPIPAEYLHTTNQTFILKVHGESMINAGILDGDHVLVEQCSNADNGDMVVALLDDSATVKTFYKENGHYRLQPENDYMDPIIIEDHLQIMGKVIGVFRFF